WTILNTGNGHFGTPLLTQLPAYALAGYFLEVNHQGVAVADFDRDGKLDVIIDLADAIDNAPEWTAGFLKGNGDGTFRSPTSVLPSIPANSMGFEPGAAGLVAGDFNGDGIPDLALTIVFVDPNPNDCNNADPSGSLFILTGDGHGQFHVQQSFDLSSLPFIGWMATADLNGDGKLDLIVSGPVATQTNSNGDTTSITSSVTVFNGLGGGTFQQGFSQEEPGLILGLALADFRGSGKLDLAIADTDVAFSQFTFDIRQG